MALTCPGRVARYGTSDSGGPRRLRLQITTPTIEAASPSPRASAIQPHGVSLSDGVGSAATVSAGLVSGVVAVVGASLVVVGVSGSVSLPSATPSARARRKAASSSDDPPDVSVGTVVVVAGSVGAVSIVPVSTSVVVGAVSVVTVSITVVVAGCVVVVGSVTVVGDADVVAGDVSVELGRVGSVSDPVGRVTPLSDGSPEPSPPQPPRR